ncbi:MAG: sigma-70 family RNA polymerase sigma factor [Kofleriaceae bacterium]
MSTNEMIDEKIDELVERASAVWPTVRVDRERMAAFLEDRSATTHEPCADLVLACACLAGDATALALFEERLLVPIAARLVRSGLGDVAEETIGRLRAVLFVGGFGGGQPRLASYSGRGDLRGWLEVVATREAYRVARREPARGDDRILDSLPDDDDLELRHIKAQHRAELGRAFADALAKLPTRDRLVLRQRYLDALTLDEVAALHGVHRITVMRWLARTERVLLREIRRSLSTRLGLETAEVAHLVDDARSRLDLSLRGLLEAKELR